MKNRLRQSRIKLAVKELVLDMYYGIQSQQFKNVENLAEFDFKLQRRSTHAPGVSAMLRIKNEASKITGCLSSIHDVFDEIIVVNNGSTDNTKDLVYAFIKSNGATNIYFYDYPFIIARCGKENEETPENSVNSLAYYYNWCLSKCTKKWVFKWDGDMVLPRSSKNTAIGLLQQIQSGGARLWNIRGQTVYVDSEGHCWASLAEINHEEMCYPNNPMIHYRKEKNWERLRAPFSVQEEYPDDVIFYEVKDTREDEFSHWSSLDNLTPRKRTELNNFNLVKQAINPPEELFSLVNHEELYMGAAK